MPTSLSCKSTSTMDSLPRNANARRAGTALHRLQQQQRGKQSAELGALDSSGDRDAAASAPLSPALSVPQRAPSSFSVESRRPRRRLSETMAQRRRSSKGSKQPASLQGVSSNDLPPASSDTDASQSDSIALDSPLAVRDAVSDGETAMLKGIDEAGNEIQPITNGNLRTRTRSLSPRKHFQPLMNAVSPSSPGPSRSQTPISSPPSPSKQARTTRKRIVTKDMIGLPTNFQHTGRGGPPAHDGLTQSGDLAEQVRLQLSEVAAALRLDGTASVAKNTARRAEASDSTLNDASTDPMPMRQSDEAKERLEISSRANDAPAWTNASNETDSRPTSPAIGGVKRMASKRKPVPPPRHLADLYGELSTSVTAEEQVDKTFATHQTDQLERIATESPSDLRRTTSKRKPVPVPRKLSDLYGEFSQSDERTIQTESAPTSTPLPAFIAEEPDENDGSASDAPPVPTIRANGKRMVQGPAGDYITDTANGRWNKALNEITLALKSDNEDSGQDDVDIQHGLARADVVLQRLNAI